VLRQIIAEIFALPRRQSPQKRFDYALANGRFIHLKRWKSLETGLFRCIVIRRSDPIAKTERPFSRQVYLSDNAPRAGRRRFVRRLPGQQ
jgi:hypothetical protein